MRSEMFQFATKMFRSLGLNLLCFSLLSAASFLLQILSPILAKFQMTSSGHPMHQYSLPLSSPFIHILPPLGPPLLQPNGHHLQGHQIGCQHYLCHPPAKRVLECEKCNVLELCKGNKQLYNCTMYNDACHPSIINLCTFENYQRWIYLATSIHKSQSSGLPTLHIFRYTVNL